MTLSQQRLLAITRRHFFRDCGVGVGAMALRSLLAKGAPERKDPLAPKKPHFPAKAKAVIYLFMAGAPSQLELFEPKPEPSCGPQLFCGPQQPSEFTEYLCTCGQRVYWITNIKASDRTRSVLVCNANNHEAHTCGRE